MVIDGFTVTVASVGDSRCILDTQGGELQLLTVDHRLEENAEERERVTTSGGEVGRLNLFGGQEVSHFSSSESVTCLSSINSCMNAYAGGTLGRPSPVLAWWLVPLKIHRGQEVANQGSAPLALGGRSGVENWTSGGEAGDASTLKPHPVLYRLEIRGGETDEARRRLC